MTTYHFSHICDSSEPLKSLEIHPIGDSSGVMLERFHYHPTYIRISHPQCVGSHSSPKLCTEHSGTVTGTKAEQYPRDNLRIKVESFRSSLLILPDSYHRNHYKFRNRVLQWHVRPSILVFAEEGLAKDPVRNLTGKERNGDGLDVGGAAACRRTSYFCLPLNSPAHWLA